MRAFLGLVAAACILFGCSDGGVAPTMESVAGEYNATSLYIVESTPGREDDVTTDLLGAGLTISITLSAGGVTTGEMFIPAALAGSGMDETYDMIGTYTLSGTTVRFNQTASTFLREIAFTVDGSVLRATQIDGYETLSVRLTRQP
jgi:hypothetical protein